MLFIFNLQRKNKQLKIASGIYTYILNSLQQNTALIFLSLEHLLEPCWGKQVQTQILDIVSLMSLGYWHLLGRVFNKSVS
jgi:hypothetical protein